MSSSQFQNDVKRLKNGRGVLICKGRIDGDYPEYLPPSSLLSDKIFADALLRTLPREVDYTVTEVRQQYWIPRLRQLTKKVIHQCHGFKRFQVIACPPPSAGNLPRDRTIGDKAFQVRGIDYMSQIIYRQEETKMARYKSSSTAAVSLGQSA